MEIRLLPSGLTIYEMTTMDHSTFILLLATRKVKYVPEESGISCIIGTHYICFIVKQTVTLSRPSL